MCLESQLTGDNSLAIPIPGFTFGLPESIADAEKMERAAPIFMLARACRAVGKKRRAYYYAELAFQQLEAEALRCITGIALFQYAAEVDDWELIARSAALTLSTDMSQLSELDSFPEDQIPTKHLVRHTISKAIGLRGETAAVELKKGAVAFRKHMSKGSSLANLLAEAIESLHCSVATKDDLPLENAYRHALHEGEYHIARDLAWFWCFRHFYQTPTAVYKVVAWQWRVVWLSRLTAGDDEAFLVGCVDQQRQFWSALNTPQNTDFPKSILAATEMKGDPVYDTLEGLERAL